MQFLIFLNDKIQFINQNKNLGLRKLQIKNKSKNSILNTKGYIKINWVFSILCKNELNITNLSLEFIPNIKKSKLHFSLFSNNKKKLIKYLKNFNLK